MTALPLVPVAPAARGERPARRSAGRPDSGGKAFDELLVRADPERRTPGRPAAPRPERPRDSRPHRAHDAATPAAPAADPSGPVARDLAELRLERVPAPAVPDPAPWPTQVPSRRPCRRPCRPVPPSTPFRCRTPAPTRPRPPSTSFPAGLLRRPSRSP